ncbi:sporulation inhibitor of replication protein SirA [Bacillus carboniphilus]|uniref:sporulation inhibitor of replication protein SirA n=1 Tax=Bacillus carboniphilus TaxID=86663 RepID=UPI0035327B33
MLFSTKKVGYLSDYSTNPAHLFLYTMHISVSERGENALKQYYIYLIKREFANHYFGSESKLFLFFQQYHWTNSEHSSYPIIKKTNRLYN